MSKIVFIKEQNKVYDGQFSQIGEHQVRLIFTDDIPSDSVLLSGFYLVNEYNGVIQTKRQDYTYLYRKYEDNPNQIELCNDGIAWIKPEIKVSFYVNNGGTLDGETEQIVDTYEELVVPTPVANENYKFVKWNPEIPESGIIENSTTFVAEFEYVPTEEELQAEFESAKQNKIAELSSACQAAIYAGVDVGGKHYSYTLQDQKNLEDAVTIASQTALEVPYHADGESCGLYSYVDLQQIYIAEQINLTQHTTYFNQMKQYIIDTFTDRNTIEDLQGIVYGTELTGTYLDTYNSIMEQSTLIMNALGEA